MSPTLPPLLAAFQALTDTAYYKSAPVYERRSGKGWRHLHYPATRRQIYEHLVTETAVLGGPGLYRPHWTVIDLDRCTAGRETLTDDAIARYLTVQAAVGDTGIPLRSSHSGNLHLWIHHAPILSALSGQCVARQLMEVDPALSVTDGVLEIYPQPRRNHRWPFGRGSVLLESGPLRMGLEVPVTWDKLAQIEWMMARPLYRWPSLSDVMTDLQKCPLTASDALVRAEMRAVPTQCSSATPFLDRVQKWLAHGPGRGEHNLAMAEVVLYGFMQGWLPAKVEAWAWEWQRTAATKSNEWRQQGSDACRNHLHRTVVRTSATYRHYVRDAEALWEAAVPASDIQMGLTLFSGDIALQRAFFAFCRYVRPRLAHYYPDGVIPIHSHYRWQSWTERRYKALQTALADAGICVPVRSSIAQLSSTLFKVVLPAATGEVFTTWEEGVWAVCGRDPTVLRRHFSLDQIKRFFGRLQAQARCLKPI